MRCSMNPATQNPSRIVKLRDAAELLNPSGRREGSPGGGDARYLAAFGAVALPAPACSRAVCRLASCSSRSLYAV